MTTHFYNHLKEEIIAQSDTLPPLFLSIGAIGAW